MSRGMANFYDYRFNYIPVGLLSFCKPMSEPESILLLYFLYNNNFLSLEGAFFPKEFVVIFLLSLFLFYPRQIRERVMSTFILWI